MTITTTTTTDENRNNHHHPSNSSSFRVTTVGGMNHSSTRSNNNSRTTTTTTTASTTTTAGMTNNVISSHHLPLDNSNSISSTTQEVNHRAHHPPHLHHHHQQQQQNNHEENMDGYNRLTNLLLLLQQNQHQNQLQQQPQHPQQRLESSVVFGQNGNHPHPNNLHSTNQQQQQQQNQQSFFVPSLASLSIPPTTTTSRSTPFVRFMNTGSHSSNHYSRPLPNNLSNRSNSSTGSTSRRTRRTRTTSTDFIKSIVLICILALTSHTINTIPKIQLELDQTIININSSGSSSSGSNGGINIHNNPLPLQELDDNMNGILFHYHSFHPIMLQVRYQSFMDYYFYGGGSSSSSSTSNPIGTDTSHSIVVSTIKNFVRNILSHSRMILSSRDEQLHTIESLIIPPTTITTTTTNKSVDCFVHEPMYVNVTKNNKNGKKNNATATTATLLLAQPSLCNNQQKQQQQQPSPIVNGGTIERKTEYDDYQNSTFMMKSQQQQQQPFQLLKLRRNWTEKWTHLSPIAQEIEEQYTSRCSSSSTIRSSSSTTTTSTTQYRGGGGGGGGGGGEDVVVTFNMDNLFGLGSHLYVWSQALCNALEYQNATIITYNPQWLWLDQTYCPTLLLDDDGIRKGENNNNKTTEMDGVRSPFTCYFPSMEERCSTTTTTTDEKTQQKYHTMTEKRRIPLTHDPKKKKDRCTWIQYDENENNNKTGVVTLQQNQNQNETTTTNYKYKLHDYRAASIEYIFQQVSPLVVHEAERQLNLLFNHNHYHHDNHKNVPMDSTRHNKYPPMERDMGSTLLLQKQQQQLTTVSVVPTNLITVHIRWGDKFWEMDLVPIDEYIEAIYKMIHIIESNNNSNTTNENHRNNNNTTTTVHRELDILSSPIPKQQQPVHIYLACEDPIAVQEFLNKTEPLGWNIYVDRTILELDEFRPKKGNRASHTTRNTKGRAGLVALGSLLVAMEANYYILTTSSNWSRIMNHLRMNIVNRDPTLCYNQQHKQPCTTHVIDLRPGIW